MKKCTKGIPQKIGMAEERISKLEGKSMEIVQSKEQKENVLKKF